jgi:dihydrofolate synthase/folylpolyglutamate synthase
MEYTAATTYLAGLTDYEISPATAYNAANFDLRRVETLLRELGQPHRGRKTVHIAGTKGKGSTAAMMSSILVSAGNCTGLFTSPHLYTWQERIAVNGRQLTKRDFARLTGSVKKHVQAINGEARFGKITTFEALTAMAFLHFRDKGAAFQVLETGMGGRLDATNVANPDVCILTSISYDHTQVLGNTLAKIATEKAGIIKPGCTVICAPQQPEALAVITERCRLSGSELVLAGKDVTWKRLSGNLYGQTFTVRGRDGSYKLHIPLLGDHQMENACLAVAAAEVLRQRGAGITCDHILRGLGSVKWPARLQVLKRAPLLIIDGAHNAYSMNALVESVKMYFPYKRLHVIFGSSSDKDIDGMAGALAGFAGTVIITSSGHPRAASAQQLARIFRQHGISADIKPDARAALSTALAASGDEDLILATGSLFLAAEIGSLFREGNFG